MDVGGASVDDRVPPFNDNSAIGAQQIPLGLSDGGNVGVDELSLFSPLKPYLYAFLIGVGYLIPHPVVASGCYRRHRFRHQGLFVTLVSALPQP
jgi:hypothetical protein